MARPGRRSSSGEDEGGGANWMDTYGDLVTLLLCFFVLLFSFSSINAEKWQALVGAFSGSTAVQIPVMNPEMAVEKPITLITRSAGEKQEGEDAVDDANLNLEALENLQALFDEVLGFINTNDLPAEIIKNDLDFTLIVRFGSNVFFDSGDARLLPEALPMLDALVTVFESNIARYDKIRIEGHTDNRPINTVTYPSNWELSTSRATSTLKYILDNAQLDPALFSPGGYGEYHPIAENDTAEGRAANRRVDFVLEGKTDFNVVVGD
jgi:chemotaxis protein MotB